MAQRAIIVGSGPNGLSAGIALAQAGLNVTVLEAEDTIGGGTRSAALTLPEFTHDVCSAIHPMAIGSPFFRSLQLERHGLHWIQPPAPLAHPLDDGTAVLLDRSLDATADGLGADSDAYRKMFGPLVEEHEKLFDAVLRPLLPPRHPLELARFGISAVRSAAGLARSHFRGERARALFAGLAAHSLLPLTAAGSASFGLVLGTAAHIWGWPMPRGGSQRIADALATHLKGLGGSIVTNNRVLDAGELAGADAVMFDTSPRVVVSIAGNDLQPRYRTRLLRFRAGPGAFKMDWALSAPIPWRAMECARAGTVHLGGTLDEISRGEREVAEGRHPERPFVLLAQPSLFDDSRAPLGRHTAWAYCHVPNGSTVDMCARIEAQVERFAPGFRDLILARHHTAPADFERDNANYTGGDIAGGANDLWQTFARPVLAVDPYLVHAGRDRAWFICSASTPPGAGVHGMCGFNAAESALRRLGMKG